jgi:hypothetical protein
MIRLWVIFSESSAWQLQEIRPSFKEIIKAFRSFRVTQLNHIRESYPEMRMEGPFCLKEKT